MPWKKKLKELRMFILENETLRDKSQLVFKYLIKLPQIKGRRKKISITSLDRTTNLVG